MSGDIVFIDKRVAARMPEQPSEKGAEDMYFRQDIVEDMVKQARGGAAPEFFIQILDNGEYGLIALSNFGRVFILPHEGEKWIQDSAALPDFSQEVES